MIMRLKVKGFVKKFEKLRDWILAQDFETRKNLANELYMSVSELELWLTKIVDDVTKLDNIKIDIDEYLNET